MTETDFEKFINERLELLEKEMELEVGENKRYIAFRINELEFLKPRLRNANLSVASDDELRELLVIAECYPEKSFEFIIKEWKEMRGDK